MATCTADQLTRETTGGNNTDYWYDANGNVTRKSTAATVHSYAYDFRNLMTSYNGPGTSNDTTYTYDAGGRRITKNVNGSKTAYFHDGLNVVAEYNGSDQLQRTYVTPGLDANLTMTASGSTYYYLSDALGSIRQVIDANEATQNAYDYEAFGKVYGSPTENVPQPFRFTARAWDAESSLYYYRARYYDATRGHFLARDPALASSGPYNYVQNVPTYFIDPLGLWIYIRVLTHSYLWDDTGTGAVYDYYSNVGRWTSDRTPLSQVLGSSVWQYRLDLTSQQEKALRDLLEGLIGKARRKQELCEKKGKEGLTPQEHHELNGLCTELWPWERGDVTGVRGLNCINAIALALRRVGVVRWWRTGVDPKWGIDNLSTQGRLMRWLLRNSAHVDRYWFKHFVPGETIGYSDPYAY